MNKEQKTQLAAMRAQLDKLLETAATDPEAAKGFHAAMAILTGTKPMLPVTQFWMRNNVNGYIEVLAEVMGKWLVIFGGNGPGPVARDEEQLIDHVIHSGGIANLRDYGSVHGGNSVTPASASMPICATCGHPRSPHKYRHRFVEWKPGMPKPRGRGVAR